MRLVFLDLIMDVKASIIKERKMWEKEVGNVR